MIYRLEDRIPSFDESNFIAASADLIGSVVLKKGASIWFNCVIRADNDSIVIGENANIQDGSVLHVDPGAPIHIGANVTVGHKVMLHGCTIEEGSLIGMNAVILNDAHIGKNCLIGANALVTEKMIIPDNSLVLGSPAKVIKEIGPKIREKLLHGAEHYVKNGERYKAHLKPI